MVPLILVPSLIKTTHVLKNGFTIQIWTAQQQIKTVQILSKNQLLKFIQLALGKFYKGEQKRH